MPRRGAKLSPEAAERQRQAIKSWQAEHTVNVSIRWRKEDAARYKALAARRGMSFSGLLKEYLDAECEKEGL